MQPNSQLKSAKMLQKRNRTHGPAGKEGKIDYVDGPQFPPQQQQMQQVPVQMVPQPMFQ